MLFQYIISLVLIFIESSLPTGGGLVAVTFPFVSAVIRDKNGQMFIFLAYIILSLQSDRYLYNLIVLILYIILNYIFFEYIDFNKLAIIYLVVIQVIFYLLLSVEIFSIKYLIINIVGFLVFNYIYAKYNFLEANKWNWNLKEKKKNLC